MLFDLNPPPGAAIGIVASGSFPGANIAAIAAVEALGFKPVIVSSLGSSMYRRERSGIRLARHGIRSSGALAFGRARTTAVVLGGESATAESLTEHRARDADRAARRNGYEPIVARDLAELKHVGDESDAPTPRRKESSL